MIKPFVMFRAQRYLKKGDLDNAYAAYKEAADAGNVQAMTAIGIMYLHYEYDAVEGLPNPVSFPWSPPPKKYPNTPKAFHWFSMAAEKGDFNAMHYAGVMLCQGTGCPKDPAKGRTYLETAAAQGHPYAMKAMKDFFGVSTLPPLPDEAYDNLLAEFQDNVEAGKDGHPQYVRLMNGSDRQLARFGLLLAKGQFRSDEYRKYSFPCKSNGRSCAPVTHFRWNWGTVLIVDREALGDSMLSFASDISQNVFPIAGAQFCGDATYDAEGFGWLRKKREAQLYRFSPWSPEDMDQHIRSLAQENPWIYTYEGLKDLLEHIQLTQQEALLYENGEKEFTVELAQVQDGEAAIICRYTVDGADQGDRPATVTNFQLLDGK